MLYYILKFKYKSIDSDNFKAIFCKYFDGKMDGKLTAVGLSMKAVFQSYREKHPNLLFMHGNRLKYCQDWCSNQSRCTNHRSSDSIIGGNIQFGWNSEILHGLCRLYIKGRLINRLNKVLTIANSNGLLNSWSNNQITGYHDQLPLPFTFISVFFYLFIDRFSRWSSSFSLSQNRMI